MEMYLEFRIFLESMGYKVKGFNDPLDNLTLCISYGVYGTPAKYDQVEAEIDHYMVNHLDEFAYIILDNGKRVKNPIVKHLIPDATWETNKTLAAISHLYGVGLTVITNERSFHQYPEAGGQKTMMTLSYDHRNENHFSVLTQRPMQVPDEAIL